MAIGLLALVLSVIVVAIAVVQTGWAKDLIRDLIVRQANQYLTATLSIGRLEGSLLRGLQLGDISLGRDGQTLIRIDEVALTYSIRELFQKGVVIRSVRLTRPYVVGAKMADGRWDLGALVKRELAGAEPHRPESSDRDPDRSRSSTAGSRCRTRSTSAPRTCRPTSSS